MIFPRRQIEESFLIMSKRTRVFRVDPKAPEAEAIAIAGRMIRAGGLVAFPTETVYGLGANALDETAVAKIFAAKGRPSSDPLIVHIARFEQLSRVAQAIPAGAVELGRQFWPGPLTLVLQKAPCIPANLTAGLNTVAVRMPDHEVALALLQAADLPIAAPSANQFSRPSPTSAQHVIDDLADRVEVVLDGGNTPIGLESTIVSLVEDEPRVLRPGGISLETLREALPNLRYEPSYLADDAPSAPAPGTMLRHYSPRARVILFSGADAAEVYAAMRAEINSHERVGILASDADAREFAGLDVAIERLGADADEAAHHLFAALRSLDQQGVDCILARAPERRGLGLALWDRLLRASVGSLVEVGTAPSD
ncbi:MAG: L-threonylcarbamoyladenylate synthase [Chloroflexi bacterium]|nr:L-threonylcarbamoyladenylate synthase [Chloroflexota bacterium]